MKNSKVLIYLLIIFFTATSTSFSSEKQAIKVDASSSDTLIKIDLQEAIRLTLMNNFDIEIAKLDRKIISHEVGIAENIYDANLSVDINYKVDEDEPLTSLAQNKSNTTNFNIGVLKKFFFGSIFSLDLLNKRNSSNNNIAAHNPYYDTTAKFSVKQPILKNNFGMLDRAGVKLVKLNVETFDLPLLSKIENSISNVEISYWKLWFNYQFIKIKEESLNFANKFFQVTQEQFDNGALEETDLFAAEANVAQRESDLLKANVDLKNAVSDLNLAMNYFPEETILPIESLNMEIKDILAAESLKIAFKENRLLASLRVQAEANQLTLKMKENSLLPNLDLVATYSANGLARDYIDNLGEVGGSDDPTYYIGMELSIPLGNSKINGELQQAEIEKLKIIAQIKKAEKELKVDIEKAIRAIILNAKQINYSRNIISLQEKKLHGEEKKYNFGRSSSDIILRYENDLLNAKVDYYYNLTDYKTAIVSLKHIQNVLLDEVDWVTYEKK